MQCIHGEDEDIFTQLPDLATNIAWVDTSCDGQHNKDYSLDQLTGCHAQIRNYIYSMVLLYEIHKPGTGLQRFSIVSILR